MGRNIRQFKSFQNVKRFNSLNESVTEIGNMLKVSNIDVKKSDVKSYINRVKQEMDKDLSTFMSLSDVAEEMVKYALENGSPLNELPTEALLGGTEEMADEPIETGEVDVDAELEGEIEETPEFEEPSDEEGLDDLESDELEDTIEGEEGEEGEDIIDEEPLEGEEGEEGEVTDDEPVEGEEGEVTDEDEEDTTEEGEEEDELPI